MCLMSTSVRTTTVMETSEWYDGAFLLSVCSERSIREDDSGSGDFGHLLLYLVAPVDA